MHRLITLIGVLYSCFALAKSTYQVDLIVFIQQPLQNNELLIDSPFLPINGEAIHLKKNSGKIPKPYCLLPNSYSNLQDQYYQLNRKLQKPVLGYYSWRQPENNQSTVVLPRTEHQGWQLQGTLSIKKSNYYNFDAKLQVAPPSHPNSSFSVVQKHRLKEHIIYYLDNDNIGMVVKIHKIS
jgi:hypothetical protein